jgi:hypothetical protein
MGSDYQGLMMICRHIVPSPSCAVVIALLLALAIDLGGCAEMSEGAMNAFADPAKYDMYDCKQLQDARKALALRAAELQGLMAKAETGVAGSVVAEVAYRNDYISTRASSKLADQVWERDKCVAIPDKPAASPAAPAAPVAAPRRHAKATNSLPRSGGGGE